ncbi:hypothetical protein QJS10_CPA10g01535 [Acorus calamus]|uniref:RING-type domain-containing protein n=1 Tax=Acorus calamus TaxID=4465 RepID=A0AAV9E2R1_ACOCL|nr:hypothetical protein QJS10_CPA10g01542 [Acorus calamus]KAK1307314.1 hypothetical protein QJS10_CPA10g01535 [Acorus calamus]
MEGRQRLTLSDQFSFAASSSAPASAVPSSTNLSDLLSISRDHRQTLTLASILSIPPAKTPGRTLLDIIRDESEAEEEEEDPIGTPSRLRWRGIRDRLRIRRPDPAAAPPSPAPPEEAGRMSLMALLEQTDRRSGMALASLEAADVEAAAAEAAPWRCCVCMERHKGAAFIPCGHTFCRVCSRELWVSRGNCPLCNGSILEILDIF